MCRAAGDTQKRQKPVALGNQDRKEGWESGPVSGHKEGQPSTHGITFQQPLAGD
jgi:hypothetical protein